MESREREQKLLKMVDDTYMSLELVLCHVDKTVKLAETGEMLQCINNLNELLQIIRSMLDGHSIAPGASHTLVDTHVDQVSEALSVNWGSNRSGVMH